MLGIKCLRARDEDLRGEAQNAGRIGNAVMAIITAGRGRDPFVILIKASRSHEVKPESEGGLESRDDGILTRSWLKNVSADGAIGCKNLHDATQDLAN